MLSAQLNAAPLHHGRSPNERYCGATGGYTNRYTCLYRPVGLVYTRQGEAPSGGGGRVGAPPPARGPDFGHGAGPPPPLVGREAPLPPATPIVFDLDALPGQ